MNSEFLPTIKDIIISAGSELTLLAILLLFRIIGVDLFQKTLLLKNYVYSLLLFIMEKKLILIYTDCNDGHSTTNNIVASLDKFLNRQYIIKPIYDSESLLTWKLTPAFIASLFVLITDVTPLSTNRKKREKIQRKIIKYVESGGISFLGHDILYRRTRNDLIQKIAGCRITKFHQCGDNITYIKNSDGLRVTENIKLLDALPGEFSLPDREYITGEWSEEVEFLYFLRNSENVPLITRKKLMHGVIIWINSGDHNEKGPPPSLSKPSNHLIEIFGLILKNEN